MQQRYRNWRLAVASSSTRKTVHSGNHCPGKNLKRLLTCFALAHCVCSEIGCGFVAGAVQNLSLIGNR
jgi:hypothetical protein